MPWAGWLSGKIYLVWTGRVFLEPIGHPPRCWIVIVGVEVDFKDLLQFLSEIYCRNITLIHLTSDVLSWVGGKGQSASVCARKAAFILGHPQRALARWSRESNYTHAMAFNTQILPVFHFVNHKSTWDGVMKKQRASSMLLNRLEVHWQLGVWEIHQLGTEAKRFSCCQFALWQD